VLWIYIGFNSYPDPAFLVNADLDPGFDDPKIEQNVKLKQICCIFLSKIAINLSLGAFIRDVEANREVSFIAQKRTSS
jgi:hypothetical protein